MPTLQNQIGHYKTVQSCLGALAALMLLGFYLMGIRPAQNQQAVIASMIVDQKAKIAAGQSRTANLGVIEQEVADLQTRFERFDKKLPKKPDMDQFMREITRVSDQAALKKVSVQPGTPRRGDLFSEIPIALNFTGDFPKVVDFLQQTEEMQRLTRVRSLTIKTKDAQTGNVEVDVSMSIYFADE